MIKEKIEKQEKGIEFDLRLEFGISAVRTVSRLGTVHPRDIGLGKYKALSWNLKKSTVRIKSYDDRQIISDPSMSAYISNGRRRLTELQD